MSYLLSIKRASFLQYFLFFTSTKEETSQNELETELIS